MSEAASTGPRGPYAKTQARREDIRRAAHAIVLERGHRALTTAEVAKRAGISERAMLYHFPTREHLLVGAAEVATDDSWSQDHPLEDGADALDVLARSLARVEESNVHLVRLMSYVASAATDSDHPAHQFMRARNERALNALTALVRDRQAAGEAHPDIVPEVAARQILAIWGGLNDLWLTDPTFDIVEELQDAFHSLTGQHSMRARRMIDDLLTKI
ncbi:TetR/AcrR family transcriptional regulator [Microbacterium rhizosphaerae]|uniref:TetR/AcrR family transcriptional regulator n=1 Tax=Microbacterium rhizosphaerae TaxID=1678237 RepID=A0ABZ0SNX5_9MICO|nr:TetR/AcrR family transcriptional regulator [Microbacterium rhizosphaerae]WPR89357.1 TetR/AcrR family transcriptional regulator [Microbacterium rhizosphaerae]